MHLLVRDIGCSCAGDQFVADLIESGEYQSQSEVVREGLRLLKERKEFKQLRLDALREIALGGEQADLGGFVDGEESLRRIRAKDTRPRARDR